jgi:hypothetical protein
MVHAWLRTEQLNESWSRGQFGRVSRHSVRGGTEPSAMCAQAEPTGGLRLTDA